MHLDTTRDDACVIRHRTDVVVFTTVIEIPKTDNSGKSVFLLLLLW